MATITLPAPVPALPRLTSLPAGALDLEGDLRAALVNGKEVQRWAEGVSGDAFGGDAAEASLHAVTRFARRLDVAEAALECAVLAAARFEDRLARLWSQRRTLDGDRSGLNSALEDLRVEAAAASDADLPRLQERVDRWGRRAARLLADVADWSARVDEAEADFLVALARVDTLAEGQVAATDPARVDPDVPIDRLGDRADDPAAVARWWRRLSAAERQAVLAEFPALVGALAGVPVRFRDAANSAAARADVDDLGGRAGDGEVLGDADQTRLDHASAVTDLIDGYREQLDPLTGEPIALLTVYAPDDHSGDGGVAFFLGDPDRADHVAVYVPGTLSETTTLDGTVGNIDALRAAAIEAGGSTGGSVAVGFWLDYDAPSIDGPSLNELADLAHVVTPAEAQAGGADLADYLDGLRASDQGEQAHLSLLGHSYGATTASHAAQDGAPMDDLVLLGSPGAPTAMAEALTSADVWVGSADHDPVTLLGGNGSGLPGPLGHDPAQETFGAERFEVDPGSYRLQDLIDNHSSYFADESLDNIAAVVTGRDPDADGGRTPGSYQTLDQLLVGSSLVSGGEWLFERGEDAVGGIRDTFGDLTEGLVGLPHAFLPPGVNVR